MPLPAILAGLSLGRLIAGAVLLGLLGWGGYSVYASIRDKAYARGVADQVQAETLCTEGTVCADAAVARAAEQTRVVTAAVERAKEDAARAAGIQLEQEIAARAAAESRADAARAAAGAAERRYQQALAANQACATWAATPVPCPLTE